MKGVFGHDVEEGVGVGDSLKRLKRSCLKPLTPRSGGKRAVGSRRSMKKVSLDPNQHSILEYYQRKDDDE